MKFSVDTNIIIGLVNSKDRLHIKSVTLFNDKRDDELFLCSTALKESQNKFRNSINQVIAEIIINLPIFQNQKMSEMKYQEELIIAFKEIKSKHPGKSNFLDLIYDEILKFLKENERYKLPSFLSELGIKYSQSLYRKVDDIHPDKVTVIYLNHKNLKIIKEKTIDTYFKDSYDEKICYELMTNLPGLVPIDFYTGDKEFSKKINQCSSECLKYFGYSDDSFSCIFL